MLFGEMEKFFQEVARPLHQIMEEGFGAHSSHAGIGRTRNESYPT